MSFFASVRVFVLFPFADVCINFTYGSDWPSRSLKFEKVIKRVLLRRAWERGYTSLKHVELNEGEHFAHWQKIFWNERCQVHWILYCHTRNQDDLRSDHALEVCTDIFIFLQNKAFYELLLNFIDLTPGWIRHFKIWSRLRVETMYIFFQKKFSWSLPYFNLK